MSTIEQVIERQHELYGVIARAIENLHKLGPAKINRSSVQSRLEALKSNWTKFQLHHESLFKLRTPETKKNQYFTENFYSMCEETFLDAYATMLDMLSTFEQPANQATTSAETTLNLSAGSHSRHLPRIDLPKFLGDYAKWSHFRDLFASMINSNTDLSAIEKLHYLKMSLSGEPATLLKNIEFSSEGFTRAWNTLLTRFENKRILVDAQLSALFAIRKVKPECSSEVKRILCEIKEAVGALAALGCPVQQWDMIIIFVAVRKLDSESLKDWEKSLGASSQPPSLSDFEKFLLSRILALEAIERMTAARKPQPSRPSTNAQSYTAAAKEQQCVLCSAGHYISFCPKYLEKSHEQRQEVIVSKKLCFNCLGPHKIKACRTTKRCRFCSKQHHSTLHAPNSSANASTTTASTLPAATPVPASAAPSTHNATVYLEELSLSSNHGQVKDTVTASHNAQSRIRPRVRVLLATATVTVSSSFGNRCQVRALLDQGSEVSFISESVAQARLPRRAASIPILGIGAKRSSVSKGLASLKVTSRINTSISLDIDALILPKLTAYLPPSRIDYQQWPHLNDLQLADPDFALPVQIDLILGASVYAQILEDGIRRGKPGDPIAQRTTLGWVLSGPLSNDLHQVNFDATTQINGLQCSLDLELLDLLQRFWTQEEIAPPSTLTMTPEESQCENHFQDTHSRDSDGRFVVRLPLKKRIGSFGDSRTSALKALCRMERRFELDPSLKTAYHRFMREYRELDHMRPVDAADKSSACEFFLPHHDVIRETNSTTKLRVVFNGSQKTNFGYSLNDHLHVGPKLQTELSDILLR